MNEDDPLSWPSAPPIFGDDRFPPLSSVVAMHFGARSHPGHRQAINTDHYMVARFGRVRETLASSLPPGAALNRFDESGFGMVVADGMGPGSEFASRLAVSTLAHLALQFGRWNVRVDENTAWEIVQRAERFYQRVDETVSHASHEHPGMQGMSTTLTATYSGGDELFVVHVGHSRAYLYRSGLLTRLTRDQTMAQRASETGRARPTELAARDLRHILTDAIGGHAGEADIQIENLKLLNGDVIMLCTNGLTDLVDDGMIADALGQRRSPDEHCQALVNLSLERGGTDNVTVLLGQYDIPAT